MSGGPRWRGVGLTCGRSVKERSRRGSLQIDGERAEMPALRRDGLGLSPPDRRGHDVICRKCFVSGRVQGVFYRATTAQRARELGVTGYAKNLPDGRVEVLACGEAEAVNELVEWLWTGSSASKVTAVEVSDVSIDPTPDSFFSR